MVALFSQSRSIINTKDIAWDIHRNYKKLEIKNVSTFSEKLEDTYSLNQNINEEIKKDQKDTKKNNSIRRRGIMPREGDLASWFYIRVDMDFKILSLEVNLLTLLLPGGRCCRESMERSERIFTFYFLYFIAFDLTWIIHYIIILFSWGTEWTSFQASLCSWKVIPIYDYNFT